MKEEEMENQETFFKYDGICWHDKDFDFQIYFYFGNVASLSHYCEDEDDTWFIKNLKNIEDLKRVYEAITDKEFKILSPKKTKGGCVVELGHQWLPAARKPATQDVCLYCGKIRER